LGKLPERRSANERLRARLKQGIEVLEHENRRLWKGFDDDGNCERRYGKALGFTMGMVMVHREELAILYDWRPYGLLLPRGGFLGSSCRAGTPRGRGSTPLLLTLNPFFSFFLFFFLSSFFQGTRHSPEIASKAPRPSPLTLPIRRSFTAPSMTARWLAFALDSILVACQAS
jgi:hypothetical protein